MHRRRRFRNVRRGVPRPDNRCSRWFRPSAFSPAGRIRLITRHAPSQQGKVGLRTPESERKIRRSKEIFDAALRLEQALRKEIGIYDAIDFLKGDLYMEALHSYD
jgi:hypothetical protein